MKKHWSKEEIASLSMSYMSGVRVKIIAKELGRSTSATSKMITRIGATRQAQYKKMKVENKTIVENAKSKFVARRKKRTFDKNQLVNFSTVKNYLLAKGYDVSNFSNNGKKIYRDEEEIFSIGNKPTTKMKLLLIANRLRVDERQPIFSSRDITWY